MSKRIQYRIFYWVNICVVMAIIITFTILTYISINDETEPYFQMLKNWDHDPILEFYLPQNNQDVCDKEDTNVFIYNWPGIHKGCQCTLGYQSLAPCCSALEVLAGDDCCIGDDVTEVGGQDFQYLNIGKSQNQKLTLCAKRLKGYSFHNKYLKSMHCKEDEKMCGGFDKETEDYSFCVPKNSQCPIQEIYFSDQPVLNADLYPLDLPPTSYNLYVKRSSSLHLPLAQFKVNNSLTVCWSEEKEYLSSKSFYFDNRVSSCSSSSKRFSPTNIQNQEKELYKMNLSYDMEKQPKFDYNTEPYYLLQKQYVFIKMSCRDRIPGLYDNSDNLRILKKVVLTNLIICIINTVALCFFEFINMLNEIGDGTFENWEIKLGQENCYDWMYWIKFVWLIICIGVTIYINAIYIKQISFMEELIDQGCFNGGEMNTEIEDLIKTMKRGYVITTLVALLYQLFFTDPNPTSFFKKIFSKYCQPRKSTNHYNNNNNNNNNNTSNNNQSSKQFELS